ncbi:MAG TPA: histidine--tRNA ligase, partial [Pyrinomonadaceae bacterium]|nr:histidine--tRNA ligase [Pyrinomonadaceae bacterium]
MSKTNPARGMRDFLPADVRKREYVIGIIKEVYESYGFEPLETPAVENLETLMGKYGEEGNQLIFKILKRGEKLEQSLDSLGGLGSQGSKEDADEEIALTSKTSKTSKTSQTDLSDLALRYDLTVPLARVVAHHRNDLPKFFKRYQIQPVWRADRPARGRFREFYQCDVDAIGSTSVVVEAELISAVCDILIRLGFDDFVINLNHREVLLGILAVVGILGDEDVASTVIALDKLDKIGKDGVRDELHEKGVNRAYVEKLFVFVDQYRALYSGNIGTETYNDRMARTLSDHFLLGDNIVDPSVLPILDLSTIIDLLKTVGQNQYSRFVRLNPTLARGLSYYTGAIFEITVPDLAGSLGGGGRYDGLIGMFGKEQIPACGFSLGLERILVVMEERDMFPPEIADSTPADVMVTIWSDETIAESLKLAAELRTAGIRVTVYPEPDKFG